MGTRSLTIIQDEDGREIMVMYRQFDGYPSGHGADLAKFLDGREIVNGIRDSSARVSNGFGCLAAQMVAEFKDGPGNIYIYPAGTRDCWEDYRYFVSGEIGAIPNMAVCEGGDGEAVFNGSPAGFLAALAAKEFD